MLFSTDFLALEIDWLLRLFSRALPMLLKSSIIFEEARDLAMPRSLAWLWCHPKNNGQSNVYDVVEIQSYSSKTADKTLIK
jgi:hypothetical protein